MPSNQTIVNLGSRSRSRVSRRDLKQPGPKAPAGPVADAAAAHARGDGFFELWVQVAKANGGSALLAEIERIGWRLEHTGYAFNAAAPVAVYLFRRDRSAVGQLRAPTRTAEVLPAPKEATAPPRSRRARKATPNHAPPP